MSLRGIYDNRERRGGPRLRRHLSAGVVYRIAALQQELRNRDDRIAVLQQVFDYRRQGLGRVFRGVVEQYDAAGLNFARDAIYDLGRREIFPVEAVITRIGWSNANQTVDKPAGAGLCQQKRFSLCGARKVTGFGNEFLDPLKSDLFGSVARAAHSAAQKALHG